MMNYQQLMALFVSDLTGIYPVNEIKSMFFRILEKITGIDATRYISASVESVDDNFIVEFNRILNDLRKNKPLQYILNETWFYDRAFYVDNRVLIPRPETEEIVHFILSHNFAKGKVLDIGTGSGCIAVTLAKESKCEVFASDFSIEAIEVARINANKLGACVSFIHDDVLNPKLTQFPEFDLIVSNPPYVRDLEKAMMQENVLFYEPPAALYVRDNDPLVFYRAIANFASQKLKKDGSVVVEINEFLDRETANVFKKFFSKVEVYKDLSNKNRYLIAQDEL